MKARENAVLQLAGEVDEGVPADEQVDVRQRRRLRQVVGAEDAPAAELAPKSIELALAGEVTVDQPGGDILELLRPVDGLARGGQGLPVGVGAIDLDRVVFGGGPQALRQGGGD